VRKLFLPPGGRYFGCRRCHRLTYASCQECHRYDGLYGQIAGSLGKDIAAVRRRLKLKRPARYG
jgi:hypothetical protein